MEQWLVADSAEGFAEAEPINARSADGAAIEWASANDGDERLARGDSSIVWVRRVGEKDALAAPYRVTGMMRIEYSAGLAR